jgi:DNA-binding protein
MYISEHTVKKILKEAGAARVSADASVEMQKYLNKKAFEIAQKAVKLSKHAKRKTVDASDVKLACV